MFKKHFFRMNLYFALSRAFLVCTGIGFGLPTAAAWGAEVKNSISVAMQVAEIVQLDVLGDPGQGNNTVFALGTNCPSGGPLCFDGQGVVDFVIIGNTRVRVTVKPQKSEREKVNNRKLGVFTYLDNPTATAPKLYYDVFFDLVRADRGATAFRANPVITPDQIQLNDYTQSRHNWGRTTNLSKGSRMGRIYVQPLFNNGGSFEEAHLPLPGTYQASLSITVTPR